MATSIRQIARELSVEPADVVAIVNQLNDVDQGDTIAAAETPAERAEVENVIECPDGVYGNSLLTPEAVRALYDQFNGDPDKLAEIHGIRA